MQRLWYGCEHYFCFSIPAPLCSVSGWLFHSLQIALSPAVTVTAVNTTASHTPAPSRSAMDPNLSLLLEDAVQYAQAVSSLIYHMLIWVSYADMIVSLLFDKMKDTLQRLNTKYKIKLRIIKKNVIKSTIKNILYRNDLGQFYFGQPLQVATTAIILLKD